MPASPPAISTDPAAARASPSVLLGLSVPVGGRRLSWKQLVADVSPGGCQPHAPWLAPDGAVDLPLVADLKRSGCLVGDEDRIAHLATCAAISGFYAPPELQSPEF